MNKYEEIKEFVGDAAGKIDFILTPRNTKQFYISNVCTISISLSTIPSYFGRISNMLSYI